MAADLNGFIVSTFASWAGDVREARRLLGELLGEARIDGYEARSPKQTERRGKEDGRRWEGSPLLHYVVEERLKQLADQEPSPANAAVVRRARPLVLHTQHLRGIVWRIDYREFILQAYLVDLNLERELFHRARRNASQAPERPLATSLDSSSEADDIAGPVYGPLGASWVMVGNPFVRAQVTDLGLIEAVAVWTGAEVDDAAGEQIRSAFERLLSSLDPSSETHDTAQHES